MLAIQATTATVTLQIAVHDKATLAAYNLAGAEEVVVKVMVGADAVAYCNQSGTAVKMTTSIPSVPILTPGTYQLVKSVTVGACSVAVYT